MPPGKPLRTIVAAPFTRFTAVPLLTPFTANCTEPVGVPLVAFTVAVTVTAWPNVTVPVGETCVSVRVVAARLTPDPVKATVSGAALVVKVRVSVRVPLAVGVNVPETAQLAPAVSVPLPEQAFVPVVPMAKSPVLPAAV